MSIFQRGAAGAVAMAMLAACGGQTQASGPAGSAPAPSQSISVHDGESLIRAMHARYLDRWFKTITYTQTTTLLGPSGNNDQLWYVAMSLPGKQRIDYINPDLGNGLLVRSDSTYLFSGGRPVRESLGWNDLLLLTQDVYLQPPEVTISILRALGYQMSRLRTSSFDGKSAWIVGASSSSDSSSKQFWVERDRMLLVRLREKRGDDQFSDIRIGDFMQVGNGWIARQAYQMQNSVPRVHQQLANVKVDVPLDPDLFEPRVFSTVKHWSKP